MTVFLVGDIGHWGPLAWQEIQPSRPATVPVAMNPGSIGSVFQRALKGTNEIPRPGGGDKPVKQVAADAALHFGVDGQDIEAVRVSIRERMWSLKFSAVDPVRPMASS
jgi:hypothetical protein